MEDAVEAGLAVYLDGVESGRVSAAQIPVGLGIISDKRALLVGEPTTISGAVAAQAEDLSVEALNRYLDNLPTCKDSQSSGLTQIALQNEGASVLDATLDASRPDGATVGAGPALPADRDAGRGPAAEGGGGGPDRGGPPRPDELVPGK